MPEQADGSPRTAAEVASQIHSLGNDLWRLLRQEGHGTDSIQLIECEEIQRLANNLAWPRSRKSADIDVLARYRHALWRIAGTESGIWGTVASEALFPSMDWKREGQK